MKYEKELAKTMPNSYYFTDTAIQVGFSTNLDSHRINHSNSKITFKPSFPKFGIGLRYNKKILQELVINYARLLNQYKIKCQTVLSARFDKEDEDNQALDETEVFIILNIN